MIHSGLQQPSVGAGGGREALKFLTAMKTISSTWTWATSQIGIFATTIGISKSRLRWRIFIMVCIKNMIKIMKIIIRRGGGGEGEGGRTSRLGWQNFIINSLISYGVGDASLQYNGDSVTLYQRFMISLLNLTTSSVHTLVLLSLLWRHFSHWHHSTVFHNDDLFLITTLLASISATGL